MTDLLDIILVDADHQRAFAAISYIDARFLFQRVDKAGIKCQCLVSEADYILLLQSRLDQWSEHACRSATCPIADTLPLHKRGRCPE